MPNFWTTTSQKIYEVLYGPRTRDVEFDEKVDELTQTIQAVKRIQEIIHSFHARTEGIQKLSGEIYTNLPVVYSQDVIYYEFIKDVCAAHKAMEGSYLSCVETINSLTQLSSEWEKLHGEVNQHLHQREVNRQVYDHYDEKMEKLVRSRNDKLARHHNESQKDVEKFERNDGKYKRAANDLIQSSNYSYKLMQDLLDYRYKLLNPLVSTFVSLEKKLIDSCAECFRKFDNLSAKMAGLDRAFKPTKITYDPTKHIRATRLLVGVNINELPVIIKKDKYTYEDYKQGKNDGNTPGGGGGNASAYNKIIGMDQQGVEKIQNPFSYEAYKAKTSVTVNKESFDKTPSTFNSASDQQSQWNLKVMNNNVSDTVQKNSEDVNVYNPYSSISLNTPNPIAMNSINPINPINPSSYQPPYQSQMPSHFNSDFQKNSQFGSHPPMNFSHLQRPNTYSTPPDFPK